MNFEKKNYVYKHSDGQAKQVADTARHFSDQVMLKVGLRSASSMPGQRDKIHCD